MLDTLLSPLVIPLSLRLLVGSMVKVAFLPIMRSLLIMVAIPVLLAMTAHQLTGGRAAAVWEPRLSLVSKVCFFLILIANATGCAPYLRSLDSLLVKVILLLLALGLAGFLMGFLLGRLLQMEYPEVYTVTINGGMRNNSVGSVLAAQYFPADVLFPVALPPLFSQLISSTPVRLLQHTRFARDYYAKVGQDAEKQA